MSQKSPLKGTLNTSRVLDEAASLANQQGLDKLSMTGLAASLGIRSPSLYSHIAGLDEIRWQLGRQGIEEIERRAARAAVGKSGEDAVLAIAHVIRQFALDSPGVYAATVPTPPADRPDLVASRSVEETILPVLVGFKLEGDEAIHAMRAFRSVVHGFVMHELSGAFKNPTSRDESFERLIRIFINGLKATSGETK
ncbi:MAG TPA: WHG domain-containing protein [Planktothrix sp.]